ncbi:hypothetical protein BTJ68_07664 [Hortaea werneckii EXF-2000]|uniref:Uncharacterized protein n=1 Tax=Hortaea werneckii EXF-2000 TaxID=1157616 RepID=A0A1Z5T8B8_HORWE|nr:hypothetical protein BTJ68_07664 [Hortaea werneckii EXF-2000]
MEIWIRWTTQYARHTRSSAFKSQKILINIALISARPLKPSSGIYLKPATSLSMEALGVGSTKE